jgi:hypothetical protein
VRTRILDESTGGGRGTVSLATLEIHVQRRKERAPSCTNNTLRVPTLSHVLWRRRDALGAWLNAAAGCGADC